MKSNASYKPEGFHSVNPYVMVQDAAKLLDFLKQAFDAEELGRYLDASGRIAHACVKIGDSMVEMADATEQWPPMPGSFHFYVPDVDAVYQHAVRAGATSLQSPDDKPYGERSGGVKDVCGNVWYIATRTEKSS
jgi:PhnB protein